MNLLHTPHRDLDARHGSQMDSDGQDVYQSESDTPAPQTISCAYSPQTNSAALQSHTSDTFSCITCPISFSHFLRWIQWFTRVRFTCTPTTASTQMRLILSASHIQLHPVHFKTHMHSLYLRQIKYIQCDPNRLRCATCTSDRLRYNFYSSDLDGFPALVESFPLHTRMRSLNLTVSGIHSQHLR